MNVPPEIQKLFKDGAVFAAVENFISQEISNPIAALQKQHAEEMDAHKTDAEAKLAAVTAQRDEAQKALSEASNERDAITARLEAQKKLFLAGDHEGVAKLIEDDNKTERQKRIENLTAALKAEMAEAEADQVAKSEPNVQ